MSAPSLATRVAGEQCVSAGRPAYVPDRPVVVFHVMSPFARGSITVRVNALCSEAIPAKLVLVLRADIDLRLTTVVQIRHIDRVVEP